MTPQPGTPDLLPDDYPEDYFVYDDDPTRFTQMLRISDSSSPSTSNYSSLLPTPCSSPYFDAVSSQDDFFVELQGTCCRSPSPGAGYATPKLFFEPYSSTNNWEQPSVSWEPKPEPSLQELVEDPQHFVQRRKRRSRKRTLSFCGVRSFFNCGL